MRTICFLDASWLVCLEQPVAPRPLALCLALPGRIPGAPRPLPDSQVHSSHCGTAWNPSGMHISIKWAKHRSVPAPPKESPDSNNSKLSKVDAPSGKSGNLCHPVPYRKKGDFESAQCFPEMDKTLEQHSWGAGGRVWRKKRMLREGSGQIPLLNS